MLQYPTTSLAPSRGLDVSCHFLPSSIYVLVLCHPPFALTSNHPRFLELEAMELLARAALLLVAAFLLLPKNLVMGRHVVQVAHSQDRTHHDKHGEKPNYIQTGLEKEKLMGERPDTLQIAGSKLPDCSHACGSCSPCRLVMVSFVCASIQEAETCPMAYKCMCNNKAFPVP